MKQARYYKIVGEEITDTGVSVTAKERWRTSRLIEECLTDHKECDYIRIYEEGIAVSEYIPLNSKESNMETTGTTKTTSTTTSTTTGSEKAINYQATIQAMNSIIQSTNVIISDLNKGLTLKAAKMVIAEKVSDSSNLPIVIKKDFKDLNTFKTKELFIDRLEGIKVRLADSIKIALSAIDNIQDAAKTKAPKEVKSSQPELDKELLATMATDIKASLESAMSSYMQAGKLLSSTLAYFKEQGRSAKEWEIWSNDACFVRRAQAYNLMKVWHTFGGVSEFKTCSMRVLNLLVHCKEDSFKKIEEQAKSLALKGILDTKAVTALIESVKAPVAKETTKVPQGTVKAESIEKDEINETIKSSLTGNLGTSIKKDAKDQEIAELKKQVSDLLSKLNELTKVKPALVNTVAYLPQFDESEAYLVLGVSPVAGRDAINKRYREMASIFNAKTCVEGAKKLKDAHTSLLKNAL